MTQPRLYIPVHRRYRMPGSTYRLGDPEAGDLRIEVDDERAEYVRTKGHATGRWDCTDTRTLLEKRLSDWLQKAIERDQPELLGEPRTLDGMIATIQEDVVFMHRSETSPAFRAKAIYVNVSFPSGWCPACTPGRTFLSIHSPVPGFDDFDGPGRQAAAERLFSGEDSVRFVWTLTPDNALDRRHCHRRPPVQSSHESLTFSWQTATHAYLRVERQVICPIDVDTACFFIRIYRYRLDDVDNDVRDRVRSSLLGMPEEVRRYKGLADDFDRIMSLI